MYRGVPTNAPVRVIPILAVSNEVASPKSDTYTWSLFPTSTLCGLKSRCTTPSTCAASSASHICRAIFSERSMGSGRLSFSS